MIACPGEIGASGFAAASSSGPAALWTMPEIPLPASKKGFADITIMSTLIYKIELRLIVTIILMSQLLHKGLLR